jgi:Ulp1 protease family, C-terminal catalytic domain
MVGRKTRRKNKKIGDFAPGPYQCRPRIGNVRPVEGCLPQHELEKIAKKVLGGGVIGGGANAVRNAIATKINTDPSKEFSFIQNLPIEQDEKERLQKEYLRPKQPDSWKSDNDKWLDSININDVMSQYDQDIPDFKFLGPYPIDFAAPDPYNTSTKKCLISEICKLDLPALRAAGKKRIGIIYNLDPHNKSGSHWVATYIDLNKNHCYYFDSYGMEVPDQINKFMQWLTIQEPRMKLAYNARRFQLRGSECGMYSMYFIIRMLMGEPFRQFCRRAPRDDVMLHLRGWLFST